MKTWSFCIFLYLLSHTCWTLNVRDLVVAKSKICTSLADLPANQSFTPVSDVAECARRHPSSAELFMLMRDGADGAIQCGHSSTLPRPVSCAKTADAINVFTTMHGPARCNVTSVGVYEHGGTTFCVHQASNTSSYSVAEAYCSSLGGDVVQLATMADLYIFGSFGLKKGRFWVAANDSQVQDEYRWRNGALVDPAMFLQGYPNIFYGRCVTVHDGGLGLYGMPCNPPVLVVCAVPAL